MSTLTAEEWAAYARERGAPAADLPLFRLAAPAGDSGEPATAAGTAQDAQPAPPASSPLPPSRTPAVIALTAAEPPEDEFDRLGRENAKLWR